MSARDKLPAAPKPTARDEAEKHERLLVRCRQTCRPVLHKGLKQFIAELHWYKDEAEATVYLEGKPDPVRPADLTILEHGHE